MLYRVFDTEQKKWIKENIYMSPDGGLFLIKQAMFGTVKVPLFLSENRYVCHKSIDLLDKENVLIYEGDYIKAQVAEDRTVIGLVTYAQELSSYIILCVDCDEYFTLGNQVCEYIEVIGNVFDGYEEVTHDDEQAL